MPLNLYKKSQVFVSILFLFVFSLTSAIADSNESTVSGVITDENGTPIAGAAVEISRQAYEFKQSMVTGADGAFSFEALVEGQYLLTVTSPGFEIAARELSIPQQDPQPLILALKAAGLAEEITVTGQRGVDVPLSNIPSSITVIRKEQVRKEEETASRIEDILSRNVPGFNPTNSGVRQIRGRTAQVFINGVPANEQLRASIGADINLLAPDQLAGIEVSRGANAAYGFGSPGGIIALTTPRALSSELEMDLTLRESFNPHQAGGSHQTNVHFAASKIAGNFDFHIGAFTGYDGQEFSSDGTLALAINSPSGVPVTTNSKESLYSFDTSLGYSFGEQGTLRLTGTFGYLDVAEGFLIDEFGTSNPEYRGRENVIVRFAPADDSFRRSYTLNLTYENADLWGSQFKAELFTGDVHTELLRPSFFLEDVTSRDEQFNEYRGFRSSVTTPIANGSATYGFDFLRNRFFRPISVLDTGFVEFFVSPDTTLDSFAPFAQLEFPLGEDVRVTGGIRREEYRGHMETAVGLGGIEGGDIQDAGLTLFNAGVIYHLEEENSLFFSFTQGAEITQIGRAAFAFEDNPIAELVDPRPAKSNQYEVGARGGHEGFTYSGSFFFTESDLISTLTLNPAGPGTLPLIPLREPQKFWGVELTVDSPRNDEWSVGGLLSWYDGERKPEGTDEWRPIDSATVPPVQLSGHLDYRPHPKWRNTLQLDYRSSRDAFENSTEFNEGRIDDVLLVHLSAAVHAGPGVFQIGVRNLFNKKYYAISSEASNIGFLWIAEEGARLFLSYSMSFR